MAAILRQYLCCCLPAARVDEDSERAPLLNPDILPEAPPRPQGRSTEEQRRERESLQRILEHATDRLINVESLGAFLPPCAETSQSTPSSASSLSASPSRQRRKKRPTSASWRPPMDDTPLAPVRVVQLGRNWEELPSPNSRFTSAGGRGGIARPASSHSMRTLPRGELAGAGVGSSPLRHRANDVEAVEEPAENVEDGETDSRYGTYASYRTARSSGGTARGGDVRALWSSEGEADGEVSEELSLAITTLESSIEDWSLPGGLGPFVAELDGDE